MLYPLAKKGEMRVFIILFVLWIIFNGKLTGEIVLFGLALSGLIYAFCCAFLGYSIKRDLAFFRLIPRGVRYLGLLVREIVKSNMALMRVVYSGHILDIKPKLVTFPTPLRGAYKSVLADSITVTPGTITVLCEEDSLTVHCLDESFAQGIEDTDFQKQLLEMQKLEKEGRA